MPQIVISIDFRSHWPFWYNPNLFDEVNFDDLSLKQEILQKQSSLSHKSVHPTRWSSGRCVVDSNNSLNEKIPGIVPKVGMKMNSVSAQLKSTKITKEWVKIFWNWLLHCSIQWIWRRNQKMSITVAFFGVHRVDTELTDTSTFANIEGMFSFDKFLIPGIYPMSHHLVACAQIMGFHSFWQQILVPNHEKLEIYPMERVDIIPQWHSSAQIVSYHHLEYNPMILSVEGIFWFRHSPRRTIILFHTKFMKKYRVNLRKNTLNILHFSRI